MQEWFRARSPSRAAAPIATVLAGIGSVSLAIEHWPNLPEVIGHVTIGFIGPWLFYFVSAWLILRLLALFLGKWWEKDKS